MKYIPKFSDKTKKVLKFEAKLLIAVAIGSLALYWGATAAVYSTGHFAGDKINEFANNYTTAPLFK